MRNCFFVKMNRKKLKFWIRNLFFNRSSWKANAMFLQAKLLTISHVLVGILPQNPWIWQGQKRKYKGLKLFGHVRMTVSEYLTVSENAVPWAFSIPDFIRLKTTGRGLLPRKRIAPEDRSFLRNLIDRNISTNDQKSTFGELNKPPKL